MLNIPVIKLLKETEHRLHLELLAGQDGLDKKIAIPCIQKPGLALTGDVANLHPGRIQVLGKPEIAFLGTLPPQRQREVMEAIGSVDIACMILTRDSDPPKPMLEMCGRKNIPLMKTRLLTSTFVNRATRFLEESLAATTCIHGVLLDVFGVGILLVGKSGIGKSECALDLVLRGHRLVADDIVNVRKRPPSTLYGTGSEIIRHHMEIRGLGIINIHDLFGISAVRDRKVVEMVIELMDWNPDVEYDRLGLEEHRYTILDVRVPLIQIPVRPGRNLSAIIEVAARNHLLKLGGYHSARAFQERLSAEILSTQEREQYMLGKLE
ncbi:MAG: HPr(Ser) kinase/phosphatase [Proteobacteria bacterium]|nr:HPr(Ser) kinase/phosphatase [Pseudomonadota bacterium]